MPKLTGPEWMECSKQDQIHCSPLKALRKKGLYITAASCDPKCHNNKH